MDDGDGLGKTLIIKKKGSNSLPGIGKMLAWPMGCPYPGELLGLCFDYGMEDIPTNAP